jgi:uncharacterized protein YjbI with pentapeptide repeats
MDFAKVTVSDLFDLAERGDNSIILELLVNHKSKWNELMHRLKDLDRKLHLKSLNAQNQDIRDVELSDTVIEDSDFTGSDFSGSTLTNLVIERTRMPYTTWNNTKAYDMRLSQADFSGAKMYGMEKTMSILQAVSISLGQNGGLRKKRHTRPIRI